MNATPLGRKLGESGNVAEIINILNTNSKSSDAQGSINLKWMRKLRQREDNLNINRKNKHSSIDSYIVPQHDMQHPSKLRKVIKDYDYKGNFQDISHLTKKTHVDGSGSINVSAPYFASQLRKYEKHGLQSEFASKRGSVL